MVPFFSLKAYKKLTVTLFFQYVPQHKLMAIKTMKNKGHALLINPEIFKYQYNQILDYKKDYFSWKMYFIFKNIVLNII